VTVAAPPQPQPADVEALIEAARRRQRRRRRLILVLVPAAVAVAIAGYLVFTAVIGGFRATGGSPRRPGPGRSSAAIRLKSPSSLALGPHGTLYIADDGREQILVRLSNGTLRVIAGTGAAGFSGDGGPATRARLNWPGGMVLGRDGTLYFADEANGRVRAISPHGIISTIAGNGKGGWIQTGTPARAATIGWPEAATFGPDGRLYIAASGENEILRLERNDRLTVLAGNRKYAGVYGVGGPATHASPDVPSGLAFDRAGDLYIAGFAVKTLLMITPKGIMTDPAGIGGFYPRGYGLLVPAPDGSVLAANNQRIVRLTPRGMSTVIDFSDRAFDGVTGFLPQGIAVAANGEIYADTSPGNGYTNRTALIVVRPGGTPHVLWKGK